ncbi:MAG: aminoacyl-tRNA hydrolase [Mariprofundaceae bacterium]|nr:aminoacyl-tRNA hydrolase [Mariprofundaceae bacterium]
MKMLVGLGNPGSQYEKTRHNIGFRFLELFAKSQGLHFSAAPRFCALTCSTSINHEKTLLVLPQTFMNESGEAVGQLARYYDVEPTDITVVYDDLDLPSGKIRFKQGGGHGGHNGLRSLHQHLSNSDYTRVKVGIGRPPSGDITPWVLGGADEGDKADEHRIFDALLPHIPLLLSGERDKAANKVHHTLQS